jgi:hypothetical protein
MITFAGIVVALCVWFSGLGLLEAFERIAGRTQRTRSIAERHGIGLLLGLALLPTIYAIVGIAKGNSPIAHGTGRWLALGPAIVGAALYAFGAWQRFKAGAWRVEIEHARGALQAASRLPLGVPLLASGLAAIVFFALFALFYASSLPVHLFDSLFHFAYKGKVMFWEGFGGSGWMVRSPELVDGSGVGRLMTHPNYPPGVGALHCLVGSWLGRFSGDATRPLMALYPVACALVIFAWMVRRSIWAAIVATLTWISLPFLYYSTVWARFVTWSITGGEENYISNLKLDPSALWTSFLASWIGQRSKVTRQANMPDGWMLDGAADLQQGVLFCLGVLLVWRCLARARESFDRADILAGGVLLAGACYVKNEGLALCAVAVVGFGLTWIFDVLRARRSNTAFQERWREFAGIATAFAIAGLLHAPWLAIRGDIPSVDEDYPQAIRIVFGLEAPPGNISEDQPQNVAEALARVPIVATGFAVAFVNVLRWNLVWVTFFAALATWLVARPKQLFLHTLTPIALMAIGTLTAYGIILIVTPWDLAILFDTAIPDRLLLHVIPIVIVVTTALVWRFPHEWFGDGEGTRAGAEEPRSDASA